MSFQEKVVNHIKDQIHLLETNIDRSEPKSAAEASGYTSGYYIAGLRHQLKEQKELLADVSEMQPVFFRIIEAMVAPLTARVDDLELEINRLTGSNE